MNKEKLAAMTSFWRKAPVNILDMYIIRKFLGTYMFAIMLILAITVMFDINEKLESFLQAPLKATVFDYFLNFLPYFANQFSPLFTFIAVIFFTSKLADNSEIIAMLSSGMSFRRLLRPYMISAAIIAAGTFVLGAYIIPPANVKRIDYTNTYVRNRRVDYGDNIMMQVAPGQIAYMSRYDNTTKTGYRFSLEEFKDKKLVSRLTALSIKWDTLYQWQVRDYMIRDFKGDREFITKGNSLDTVIPFEPRDFLISRNDQETLGGHRPAAPGIHITPEGTRRCQHQGIRNRIRKTLCHVRGGIHPHHYRHVALLEESERWHGHEHRSGTGVEFQLHPVHDRYIVVCHFRTHIANDSHVDSKRALHNYRHNPIFQSCPLTSSMQGIYTFAIRPPRMTSALYLQPDCKIPYHKLSTPSL